MSYFVSYNSSKGSFLSRNIDIKSQKIEKAVMRFNAYLPGKIKKKAEARHFLMPGILVEVRGVEPLSENKSARPSPSAVGAFTFPLLHARQQAYRFSSFINPAYRKALVRSFPVSQRRLPKLREARGRRHGIKPREQQNCCRLMFNSRF